MEEFIQLASVDFLSALFKVVTNFSFLRIINMFRKKELKFV